MGDNIVVVYFLWTLLMGVLTAASYMLVPAIIRFIKGKISPKRARIICIINCVVVAIVWIVVQFLLGADSANPTVAIIWFFPGYFLLRKKPQKTTAEIDNQDQKPVIAQGLTELLEEDERIDDAAEEYVDDNNENQPLSDEQPSKFDEPMPQDLESEANELACPACGKEISEEHQFCPYCGKKLSSNSKKTFFTTKTAFIILVVAAIALILTIILALVIPGCASSGSSEGEVTTAKKYSYYIGNKSTKIYHDPDCKYLPSKTNQVKIQKNLSGKRTLSDYEPCWHCQPEPPDID